MNRYIGDAKHGRLVGTDSLGNKYFENYNPYEEVPGVSETLKLDVEPISGYSDLTLILANSTHLRNGSKRDAFAII